MFLSSLSVSCQCLPLILIAVPVPGKELQGHGSQKLHPSLLLLLNVVAAVSERASTPGLNTPVPAPTERPANIMINKCITEEQKPVLKRGIDEILCNGLTCSGNYRASFNQSGCYNVCIIDIRYLKNSTKDVYYVEFGNLKTWRTFSPPFTSDHVCPTQGPSETPEADHGPGLSTGARVGLGIGSVAGIAAVFIGAGIVGYIVLKRRRSRHSSNRNEASNGDPLREVTCSGEARSLVPTAPEHQDGAAGEQNLLGNGAVQH
ncbi:uncharacterized protein LOC132833952 isoform X2 [Hemiscyllium ocellatum]|uniref:uncharacterized protein LOC132833952 isoform X2 n=1 Tax=Hemiscyllium ocellatum TaxID=170820 RepID=UPI002967002B|nr:uncharacterized protein LOC132833952 isoform X2 [Hemiscyllium ocellatum]